MYFLREAGLEYQPYPSWVRTTWNTGELCFHKNVFYRSLVDENRLEPPARPVFVPGFAYKPAWEALTEIWEEGKEYRKEVLVFKDGKWYQAIDDVPAEIPEDKTWACYWEEFDPRHVFHHCRPWKAPKAFKEGEKTVAIVNYKVGVWVSNADGNYTDPADKVDIPNQTPAVPYWEEDEDETETLSDVILDADILRAMGEAEFKFNPTLFTEERGKTVFLYLTMFFLVYDRQMANSGMNGNSAAGPVIHRTVGKMSVSYAESKLFSTYPSYEFLASNDYGRKAFNLMLPYLRGGVRILRGGSTGE